MTDTEQHNSKGQRLLNENKILNNIFILICAVLILLIGFSSFSVIKDNHNQKMLTENRPTLGVSVRNERVLDVKSVHIMDISGENAKTAGLLPGDIILEFDGKAVTTTSSLNKMLNAHNTGDSVVVKIGRDDEELDIPLILG